MSELVMRASTMSELQARIAVIENRAFVGMQDGPVEIVLRKAKDKRSNDQNRLMWSLLTDLSRQVVWHGMKLSADDWKDLTTASLRHQRAVPGIDQGFVMLGGRTSKMSKREHSELIECIYAFGGEQGVQWSDPAMKQWAEYKEVAV